MRNGEALIRLQEQIRASRGLPVDGITSKYEYREYKITLSSIFSTFHMFKVPNEYRIRDGVLSSTDEIGNNGAFLIPYQSFMLRVIASDGKGWEHVSVSLSNRCPNWREMCFIKDLFWDGEVVVMQYHPKKSEYVNLHDNSLHLWRPMGEAIPTPPKELAACRRENAMANYKSLRLVCSRPFAPEKPHERLRACLGA